MDTEKMAEGRRLAAEKRREEEERDRLEEERRSERLRQKNEQLRAAWALRCLDPSKITLFETLSVKLKTFYDEISILSKKSPDGKLNTFKLKLLNDVLVQATELLGSEFRPFPEFGSFDEADLPSSSDAALVLSHYLASFKQYRDYYAEGMNWHKLEKYEELEDDDEEDDDDDLDDEDEDETE